MTTTTIQKKIKLAVVDDHDLFRKEIVRLMNDEADFEVILEALNGLELIEKVKIAIPDVTLMDIRMPKMNGILTTEKVLSKYPNLKIIVFTQFDNEHNIIEMYSRGVKSFLSKGCEPCELTKAIRIVSDGGVYVPEEYSVVIRRHLRINSKELGLQDSSLGIELAKLSNSEFEVLGCVADRKSIKQIADELCLSPNTINNHQASIRKKLGLFGRNSILTYALSIKKLLSIKGK
jgi:two-component system response regulator DegU